MSQDHQLSLFSPIQDVQMQRFVAPTDLPDLTQDALLSWKQRIFEFQEQVRHCGVPEQGSLFRAAEPTGTYRTQPKGVAVDGETEPASSPTVYYGNFGGDRPFPKAEEIDPFALPPQNTEFWRWKAGDEGCAALYFVIDHELPIILYVGETVKSNQRWKGIHDCKRYLQLYISAHRTYDLPVTVNTGFWPNAPHDTRQRQRMESALIRRWRSPFNKENWTFWATPFVGGKEKRP
ncbi:GIY-YIG nuclease family protein [Leptolyngbya sp. AN02str]|uniref:GIY-YIG nuclease family protein n=1 Tax=Leptolyngbya sp. AN02str TaxID=3423363 RepID=UPI003D3120BA